jgi:hypothetical protein
VTFVYYIPTCAQISSINFIKFNINLHSLFVHMLVYNKHLLFNMHGMNINKTFGLYNINRLDLCNRDGECLLCI